MSIATAKAFRHEILKPAEGVFLFHARAIERLIEEQFGARVQGVSIPDLPYYLMPRDDFLFGLETENAEALSVIEGLRLPDYVILLPSPAEQRLEERSFRRLRHDYWARGFEAEVARAWQMARDDNRDDWLYGPRALRSLIGDHAFAEVRDVLDRDGATLPIWEDALVCRSFVAMVVRLRYFAPGARGFFFPAVRAWPAVDEWLTASGLDLPDPLQTNRLPMLLVRSRPGGGELPAETPLLPAALPFGASDPDLPGALAAAERLISSAAVPSPDGPAMPVVVVDGSTEQTDADRHLERRCLDALQQGSVVRRRKNWLLRTRDALDALGRRVLGRALFLPGIEDIGLEGGRRAPTAVTRRLRRVLGLTLFKQSVACAQRAEFEGRFASELRYLAEARRLAQRINRPGSRVPESIEGVIAEREASAEEQLADLLAAKWKLSPFHAAEVRALVERLAAEDRGRYGSPSARSLLAHLEQVLSESRSDYYRLRTLSWLLSLGRRRIREILPFQSLLQALGSLQAGQQRLEDLPWPLADLDRFSRALSALTDRVNGRLDAQITPRLERAMREADFVPRNHRETVAAQKMRLELLDVIKLRRHLKFTDVRDIVARNILRLPDPTIDEFFHGDRLRRFDRTAARALPGVYRPGEIYIKGLQQLGAPLFGTNVGRAILRHLLLPLGGAFLLLKSLDLIIEVIPHHDKDFHLTTVSAVGSIGILVNLIAFTGIGRHLSLAIWRFVVSMLRFVLYDGVRMLLRWPPVAQLLKSALIRGLGRNLIQPLLIGTLPLIPIIALAVLVDEVPIEPGLWLVGLAFALGTLLRNTPAGRRFLDNLSTRLEIYLRRLNQALFIGALQQLLFFFKELTRRFSQLLHRVDEALTHHLGEHPVSLAVKAVLAPLWRLAEALIQFYVTVLVEPQVNPVKHFPIVTVGHKLLLPFLPAITAAFIEISESLLPKVIAYPLVTLTIVLLPGLFGFLVWELKENWKLYQANHRHSLGNVDGGEAALTPDEVVEPAIVGTHGETMRGLMSRGFHSGTLPKGFDRLRKVINDELRDQTQYPKRLRRVQRQLDEVQHAVCVFFEREFTFALRERCGDPACTLRRVETGTPRIATNLVELRAELYTDQRQGGARAASPSAGAVVGIDHRAAEPVRLDIRISHREQVMCLETALSGSDGQLIGPECWSLINDDLRLFAERVGVAVRGFEPVGPVPGAGSRSRPSHGPGASDRSARERRAPAAAGGLHSIG